MSENDADLKQFAHLDEQVRRTGGSIIILHSPSPSVDMTSSQDIHSFGPFGSVAEALLFDGLVGQDECHRVIISVINPDYAVAAALASTIGDALADAQDAAKQARKDGLN